MNTESVVNKWLDHVHEDISAAEDLYKTGHWLYTGFLCHQAIEKALKAYWVATYNSDPPYTHSHTRLLNGCHLIDELTEEQLRFITHMEPMYIEARYPEQKAYVARMLNKEACRYILKTSKELTQWIEQRLPSSRPSTTSEPTSES